MSVALGFATSQTVDHLASLSNAVLPFLPACSLQLQSHDEGSCWLPAVLRNATLLTHWGRTDMGHRSNTGFGSDNYTQLVE